MATKQFFLAGRENGATAGIQVSSAEPLSDLKHDVANVFSIANQDCVSFHSSTGNLNTVESILSHDSPIKVKVDGNPVRDPFSPREFPIIGNYMEIFPDHMGNHERLFAKYGGVIKTVNMGTTIYVTGDPRVSEVVMSESEYFTKKTSDPSHPLYFMNDQTSLFMCDTDSPAFHISHKFIPPSMSPKAARRYTGSMQQAVQESFGVFDELDRQDKAFNTYQYMFKVAGQIIYRICLGIDVKHFEDIDTHPHEIIHLLGEYMVLMKKNSLSPQWYKYLPFGNRRRLEEVRKRLWSRVEEAIEKAEVGGNGEDLPIQEAALQSTCIADYLKRAVDENGEKLPKEYMLSNMVVLLGAGFVTSASLLSWMLYSLTKYPGCQERLLQELVDNGASDAKTWTYEEITTLPFLDCFVKETNRMHGPSFQASRNARKDVILPGGFQLPGGSVIMDTYPAVHRNKDYWDNPERFDPDRWLDKAANKKRHRMAFTPFGGGPRGCVGYNIALQEAKLALAEFVYRYEFEDASKAPMEYDPEFLVIRPLNSYVRARKRTGWPEKKAAPNGVNGVSGVSNVYGANVVVN
ncbi:cytochrome P450 [Hypoxylon sp. NC1633]|nr:cytochrome P450 [Hypoxylon sp. NC1633]